MTFPFAVYVVATAISCRIQEINMKISISWHTLKGNIKEPKLSIRINIYTKIVIHITFYIGRYKKRMLKIWVGPLEGSAGRAPDSWSQGHEFKPHIGCGAYFKKRPRVTHDGFRTIHFLKDLSIWERERENVKGGGAERENLTLLPEHRAQSEARSQDPKIMTWAKGRHLTN